MEFSGLPTHTLFIFFLAVATNSLLPTLGCQMQRTLTDSMAAKHLIGILVLTFMVVLVEPAPHGVSVPHTLATVAILYAWFLMLSRTAFPVMILVISALLVVYVIQKTKSTASEEDKAKYEKAKNIMVYAALALTLIGFAHYLILKRKQYTGSFDATTFILGKPECRSAKSV